MFISITFKKGLQIPFWASTQEDATSSGLKTNREAVK